jgi:PKD repeat protein
VVDYRWDFGDGKTGTGANVQHRYPVAGSYRIKLAVTDNRGAIAETTQSIRIGAATRPPPLVIKPGR